MFFSDKPICRQTFSLCLDIQYLFISIVDYLNNFMTQIATDLVSTILGSCDARGTADTRIPSTENLLVKSLQMW